MSQNINKIAFLITFFLIFGIKLSAQTFKESGINIGIKIGGAKLISEFTENQSIKEFTNKPGFAVGVEVSKIIFPHIELGTEFNFSILNGETDKTDHFSAIGYHYKFMEPFYGPTEYKNKLISPGILIRYYLNENLRKAVFNPFIKIGFSYMFYKSTFKYIDSKETIFGKGDENQTNLSTGMFSLGAGTKTSLTDHVYLVTSIDFNLVKYDFLDVVHNYNNTGNRINITGMYTEFKVGIFYNSSTSGSSSDSTRKKGNKSNKYKNLPFAR